MNCERFAELSDLYLVGELRAQDQEAADAHLLECAVCAEQLALDQAIRGALMRAGGVVGAPEGLAERIGAALDAPTARGPRRWRWLAAATLLLAVGLGVYYRHQAQRHWTPSRDMVHTHKYYLEQAEEPYEVVTPDRQALATWIGGRLGQPVSLVDNGWTILGARISSVNQHKAGLVFYQDRGLRISLFTIPAETLKLQGMKKVEIRGRTCWYRFHEGYRVLVWREGPVWYGAVSDGRNIVWR